MNEQLTDEVVLTWDDIWLQQGCGPTQFENLEGIVTDRKQPSYIDCASWSIDKSGTQMFDNATEKGTAALAFTVKRPFSRRDSNIKL